MQPRSLPDPDKRRRVFAATAVALAIAAPASFVAPLAAADVLLPDGVSFVDVVRHDLDVKVLPASHRLEGFDRMTIDVGGAGDVAFALGRTLTIGSIRLDGRSIEWGVIGWRPDSSRAPSPRATRREYAASDKNGDEDDPMKNRTLYRLSRLSSGEHTVEIDYAGMVYDTLEVGEGSRSGIPEDTDGLIGDEGVYLSWRTGWYPDAEDDMALLAIRVTTPDGFEAVTEGKRTVVSRDRRGVVTDWDVWYSTQGVTLVAGRYVVEERDADGVTLLAYFFESEKDLIDTYLDATAKYIELYNGLIGPYPFTKFAVVENFFPTGYGMPSYTLLGRRIIRHPFIVKTSLGHEVAHNWWGNSVYPDYDRGNWCEGLTSYFADHRYLREQSDSAAVEYRRDINLNYAAHVTPDNDMPLIAFEYRKDAVSNVVGYGKCMMVFHMLERRIGEDKFYRAMRAFYKRYRFKKATWDDIEAVFEDASGRPLDDFFDKWVRGAGAPAISLAEIELVARDAGGYDASVVIVNAGGFDLEGVPVVVEGDGWRREIGVHLLGDTCRFDWRFDRRPTRLEVDPAHDIFRRMSQGEIPLTIRRALADDSALVVVPSEGLDSTRAAYGALAERLASGGKATVVADTALSRTLAADRGVIVLGKPGENSAYRTLPPPSDVRLDGDGIGVAGRNYPAPGHAAFVAYANPIEPTRVVCAIAGNSAEAVRQAGYKVIYYGKYSYVVFLDGQRKEYGVVPPADNPLAYQFDSR